MLLESNPNKLRKSHGLFSRTPVFYTGAIKIIYAEEISRLEIDEKREPFSDVEITFGQAGAINEDNTIKL